MNDRPTHSPLGASSAERWINCPGSVELIRNLNLEDNDDPEYRRQGTAAHAALAHCLVNKLDAWEVVGITFGDIAVSVEMAEAVQVFLDHARSVEYTEQWTEQFLHHPDFHQNFYGTLDHGGLHISTNGEGLEALYLDVNDFKYGEGVVVEVEWNAQTMYYAYGKVLELAKRSIIPGVVRMSIVQPRISWHPGGVVRSWECDAETLRNWAEGTLRPAMIRADNNDGGLLPGDWCRFCPAKLICPVLIGMFEAAAKANPKEVRDFTDAELDREYPMVDGVKQYLKALEGEAFARLNTGRPFEQIKLVHKKANRVWKIDAKPVLESRLGDAIYTEPEMKSPAEIEKLGGVAKALASEYAYTPESGLTVALADDRRVGVKVKTTKELFKASVEKLDG